MTPQEIQDNIRKVQERLKDRDYSSVKTMLCDSLVMELVYMHRQGVMNLQEYPTIFSLIYCSNIVDVVNGNADDDFYAEQSPLQKFGCDVK